MGRLEKVSDENWEDFVGAPLAVLMVANSDCPACRAWTEELESHLAAKTPWPQARLGKVNLDDPATEGFRKANGDWLEIIEGVPFTVIYSGGAPKTSFYGAGVKRLASRIARLTGA